MMTFVNMDADGLVILPTHRVVHSLPSFDPSAFCALPKSSSPSRRSLPARPATTTAILGKQTGTAFVAVTRTGAFLLRARPDAMAAALAHLPERQRPLGLSQLHAVVLERLLALDATKCASKPISVTCVMPPRPSSRFAAARPTWPSSPTPSHRATAGGRLRRRYHAAKVHRLLSQVAERPGYLCVGLAVLRQPPPSRPLSISLAGAPPALAQQVPAAPSPPLYGGA